MATTATTGATARALMLLLGAAVFLNYVDRGAIAVAAPLMKGELGLSATEFGTAVSAFFWVYAPVQFVLGWLCDRLSVYRLMAWGVVLWAASTLLMGLVGGFLSLLVLRVLLGVGESIVFPGSSKIIARHVAPESRGLANSWLALGISLGPGVGILAGGMILAELGWRAIFIAFGVATLLWLVPWHRVVKSLPTLSEADHVSGPPVADLLRHWSLWAMGIGNALSNFGFYFLVAFTPLYLVEHRGLSIGMMTMLVTLGFAAQGAASLALGIWSDRWTRSGRSEASIRRGLLTVGQVGAAAAILAIPLAASPLVIGILLCAAGVAVACIPTNLYAVGQMFAGPRAAGTWIGIQNGIGNTSGIIGPIASGILIDRYGYDSAFYLAAAISAFGGLWWALVLPRIRRFDAH